SADYFFGRVLEEGVTRALTANGAEVIGSLKHPLAATDFSSFSLQAKAANPEVIAVNNGGDDTANAVKSLREFGVKAKLVGFGLDTPALVKAMTLDVGKGVYYVTSWVRRDDEETNKFVAEFMK